MFGSKTNNDLVTMCGEKFTVDEITDNLVNLCIERTKNKLIMFKNVLSQKGLIIDSSTPLHELFNELMIGELCIMIDYLLTRNRAYHRENIHNQFKEKVHDYREKLNYNEDPWSVYNIELIEGKYTHSNDFRVNKCIKLLGYSYEEFPVFEQRAISNELDVIDHNFQLSLLDFNLT